MAGMTENQVRRGFYLLKQAFWPDSIVMKIEATEDVRNGRGTGRFSIVVRPSLGGAEIGQWRLSEPLTSETVKNLVEQVAVAVDCHGDPEADGCDDREEPRAHWLRVTAARVCGLAIPKHVMRNALNLLYDVEADDLPIPEVKKFESSVVLTWRHPDAGSRLEVSVLHDGIIQVAPWVIGIPSKVYTCNTIGRAANVTRSNLAVVCPQYGASREEIEGLLVAAR